MQFRRYTRNERVKSENPEGAKSSRHGHLDVAQIGRPPGFPYSHPSAFARREYRIPRQHPRVYVCVCVCVCEREKERFASAMTTCLNAARASGLRIELIHVGMNFLTINITLRERFLRFKEIFLCYTIKEKNFSLI